MTDTSRFLLWRLKNALFRLTHPSFWLQNYRTSWEWDATLRGLLSCYDPIADDVHNATIGDRVVWVSNYPYAFGSPVIVGRTYNVLPAPLTRVVLRRRMEASL